MRPDRKAKQNIYATGSEARPDLIQRIQHSNNVLRQMLRLGSLHPQHHLPLPIRPEFRHPKSIVEEFEPEEGSQELTNEAERKSLGSPTLTNVSDIVLPDGSSALASYYHEDSGLGRKNGKRSGDGEGRRKK